MKFEEFKENVIKWAKDRKIIPNSTYKAQYIKLIEELGELALGIRKQDEKLIKDSIGDVAVILCVLSGLVAVDINPKGPKDYKGDNFMWLSLYLGALGIGAEAGRGFVAEHIDYALFSLQKLSEELGYDFNECLEIAWNEIKDRRGYLREDGIFVKEADYKKVSYDTDIDNTFKYPTNIKEKE